MNRLFPALLAEAIGVFALSFIGILAIRQLGAQPAGLIGIALAHGLILSVMVSALGAVSGAHFNPAVTIGLMFGGKIGLPDAIAYLFAQLAGGVLAGFAVIAVFPGGEGAAVVLHGTPAFEGGGSAALQGCLAEAIATFFLLMAVWGTAVDPRAPKIGGFGIGLTVTADILAIGPLTGAAMNPARAFGPALAAAFGGQHYSWETHWIYWAGPIAGAIVASLMYRALILPAKND